MPKPFNGTTHIAINNAHAKNANNPTNYNPN